MDPLVYVGDRKPLQPLAQRCLDLTFTRIAIQEQPLSVWIYFKEEDGSILVLNPVLRRETKLQRICDGPTSVNNHV